MTDSLIFLIAVNYTTSASYLPERSLGFLFALRSASLALRRAFQQVLREA